MQLVLTEEQELIAKSAADFMAQRSPVSRFRALRDAGDEVGFSKALWKEMAELGWVGMILPEEYGGAGMGMADLCIVLEAAGRQLAPEPFLSTVLLAGRALSLGGSAEQQKEWLPKIASGDAILALAYQEAESRYDLAKVATRAESKGDGFVLRGQKIQVLDAGVADALIVSARTHGEPGEAAGIDLFLVPAGAPGLRLTRQHRLDVRALSLLELDGVEVPASARLGAEGQGAELLEDVVDAATVGLCAEMLGGMSQAFDASLAHLKEREQFGVPIGSFQALKHRAARVFMDIELCRSAVMASSRMLDEENEKSKQFVSFAKARCSEVYVHVANEAVQFFGGVGMTDEYDVGFYMKRARAAELSFGDASFHRDRWARLRGY